MGTEKPMHKTTFKHEFETGDKVWYLCSGRSFLYYVARQGIVTGTMFDSAGHIESGLSGVTVSYQIESAKGGWPREVAHSRVFRTRREARTEVKRLNTERSG